MEILFFQKMELLLYSIYKHLSFFIIGFPKRSLLSAGASRIFFQSGSQYGIIFYHKRYRFLLHLQSIFYGGIFYQRKYFLQRCIEFDQQSYFLETIVSDVSYLINKSCFQFTRKFGSRFLGNDSSDFLLRFR